MLPLESRIVTALQADMGIKLDASEVKMLAAFIFALRRIARGSGAARSIAAGALEDAKLTWRV